MKDIDFTTGTIVTADFLDYLQEVESSLAWGVRVEKQSSTVVRVPTALDGSVAGAASLRINGKPRFITTALTHNFSGSPDGTYHVFAVAGAGPGFTLAVQTSASGPADSRLLAQVDWTAGAIVVIRNMVDSVAGHNWLHRPGGQDPIYPTLAGWSLPTNLTGDRNGYDANNVTLHELADVVGTIITDLRSAGYLSP